MLLLCSCSVKYEDILWQNHNDTKYIHRAGVLIIALLSAVMFRFGFLEIQELIFALFRLSMLL